MKNYYFTKNVAILIIILTAINSSIADIDNDLRGYWSFDEEDGSTIVYDYSGNENHGTIVDPNRVSGISGDALALDGVKHYVEILHSESLHSDRGITITGWFFLNEFPPGSTTIPEYDNYMALFWKGNRPDCTGPEGCGNREYGLWVRKDGFLVFISTPVDPPKQIGCTGAPTGQLKTGTWYHYGAVVNSNTGTIQVYIDGNLEGENTSYGTTGIRQTYGPLLFGGDEYDPTAWRYPFFDGLIDEIRIYDGALSQGEIQWLYEQRCMFELLGDVNNDCVFNFLDIALMAANWLVNCHRTPDDPACVYIGPEIPEDKVLIPGGEFEMGDHFGDGYSYERPVHTVTLDSFYMSKYQTTNAQYAEYLNAAMASGDIKVVNGVVYAASDINNDYPYFTTFAAPSGPPGYGKHSQINYANGTFSTVTRDVYSMAHHPVVKVSWYGAKAFCDYYGYRLPTEAEWEYAARGGYHDPYYKYPWDSNSINSLYLNYHSNNPLGLSSEPFTTPVGYYSSYGYGLCDMAGNVSEWCNDRYSDTYYSVSPSNNPQGPASGIFRVFRGGAFNNGDFNCRTAYRTGYYPNYRWQDVGFRIVLDL